MANEDQSQTVSDEILEDDQVTISSEGAHAEEASDVSQAGGDAAAKIAELEQQVADMKEQVLRAAAESQNARRRAEQDVEKAHKFAVEKFAKDMLSVADNLERAVDASKADGASLEGVTEGVELTLKTLVDALGSHKVEQVNPEGEPFNPELHQAMTMVEQPDCEPNTVINVFQKGYTLNGRLVRPAMVVVSK